MFGVPLEEPIDFVGEKINTEPASDPDELLELVGGKRVSGGIVWAVNHNRLYWVRYLFR